MNVNMYIWVFVCMYMCVYVSEYFIAPFINLSLAVHLITGQWSDPVSGVVGQRLH